MAGIINWAEAVSDPRFWAAHYSYRCDPQVFGVGEEECVDYLCILCGCEGQPELLGVEIEDEEDAIEGSFLEIHCPNMYVLGIGLAVDGTYFTLDHPEREMPLLIGSIQGEGMLPTLRWDELRQIDAWLRQSWQDDFSSAALLPLLYPLVALNGDEMEQGTLSDVRAALSTAWTELRIAPQANVKRWVDAILTGEARAVEWNYDAKRGWVAATPGAFPRHDEPLFLHFLADAEESASR
ncbi:MAG TPA: hypothetical protein VF510_05670 [Ktedonobacterales bacterium]